MIVARDYFAVSAVFDEYTNPSILKHKGAHAPHEFSHVKASGQYSCAADSTKTLPTAVKHFPSICHRDKIEAKQ